MSRNVLWILSFLTLLGVGLLALFSPLTTTPAQMAPLPAIPVSRPLTLTDRIACQTIIAQVYWDATLWPEVNPQPKPALADVLSSTEIEAQVADSLAQSVALETVWQQPITGEMLQAEIERMARHTQDPEQLQALFVALGNDPVQIAECLARPQLAERLIRQKIGYDVQLQADTRQQANSTLSTIASVADLSALPNAQHFTWVQGDPNAQTVDDALVVEVGSFDQRLEAIRQIFALAANEALPLNQISLLQEDETRFYVIAVLEQSQDRLQLMYAEWPKQEWATWWQANKSQFAATSFRQPDYAYALPTVNAAATHTPESDTWQTMPAMPWHTGDSRSVWTGSVMLVWGGAYTTNGYRYDPVLDDWRPISTIGAPHARHSFTAIWTGTEMIVYGGCNGGTEFCTDGSGGRYNPTTNTWTDIAYGSVRRQHVAVWSGSEMLVWGGCRENSNGNQNCSTLATQGVRYNPDTNTWSTMTLTNAPAGTRLPRAVWANDQMIIWNGTGGVNGRYFPATDSWQTISTASAPPALFPALVWTGTEMIAWGGCTGAGLCNISYNEGGRYNPTTDTWTATSLTNAPSPRLSHTAVWTGNEMIVWGGDSSNGNFLGDGGRYNPLTDSWTTLSMTNTPSARSTHHAHWTGSEMLIWGGYGPGDERAGSRYNPTSNSWADMTTNDPYRRAVYHASIWNGTHMISWGGEGEEFIDPFYQRARLYDPATDTWSMSSRNNDLNYFWWPTAVWTGTEMIIWGGQYGSNIFNDGTRYNPLTDTWTPTNLTNAPEARGNHTGVWTGTELIVWGGSTWEVANVNTGGRYNPATNTWQATNLSNAPSGREMHQAVWTGDEMIVWGGRIDTGYANDGGRYNPITNTWTPMSLTNAPEARIMFTSVWTGEEFIVWGGGVYWSNWTYYQTGGRYDPTADTWTPTSLTNVPEGRARFASVWTGEEMVAWGGCNEHECRTKVHTGGRYNPVTDSWTATSTSNVIEAREFHTMVWTGSEVIVWGGETDQNAYTHIGGRYQVPSSGNNAPQANADSYNVLQNGTLTVTAPGVLANDFDVDNDPLQAMLVGGPVHGQLTLGTNGQLTYVPDPGYSGSDSFTYRAYDGSVYSNVATVSITVQQNTAVSHLYLPFIVQP